VGASFLIHKYQLYHTNNANRIIPHRLGTKLLRNIQKINAVISNKNNPSLSTNFFGITTGIANAEIHKIIHKLNIFDQIIFQIDKDPLWFIAAIADKNNSGADVPIAKIVNQINNGDNLKNLAILTLEVTSLSAENPKRHNHTTNKIIAKIIDMVIFLIYKIFFYLIYIVLYTTKSTTTRDSRKSMYPYLLALEFYRKYPVYLNDEMELYNYLNILYIFY